MLGFGKRVLGTLLLAALSPALLATASSRDNLEERLLAAHNRERASLRIPPLAWDPRLAADARAWAASLAKAGMIHHYEEQSTAEDAQGENLWQGTRGYYGPESMVGLWTAEKVNYRAGVFPAVSATGRLEDVGHYTQVMWRSSRTVGCAVVSNRKDDILVCRYAEGGNVIGERAF